MSRARDFADLASAYSGGALGKRNMIRNGNMAVHQRGGTITANGYSLDGWRTYRNNLDNHAFEMTQAADVPSTFAGSGGKSLKFQTKTVESALAVDEEMRIATHIESQDCQQLLYGGSSAKKFTISFWVKCSLTGVFAMQLYMDDGNTNIGSTYTISSADTWEYKTITFVGNTSQAMANDNTIGFYVNWNLFAGSNYTSTDNTSWGTYAAARLAYGHVQNGLATTDESTWQLTGVQMEVGEVATAFEHESYAENLARCQRYFFRLKGDDGDYWGVPFSVYTTSSGEGTIRFPQAMRAKPALTMSGTFNIKANDDSADTTTAPTIYATDDFLGANIYSNAVSSMTIGQPGNMRWKADSSYVDFSAEL